MKSDSRVILEQDSVIKLFAGQAQYLAELQVYQSAAPHVPELLEHGLASTLYPDPGFFYMIRCHRVPGCPYLDYPQGFDPALLGTCLARFHRHSFNGMVCLCHIDNQPANILYSDAAYWFVDFSDSRPEAPEYDLTHLFLFWGEEYPQERFQLHVREFLSAYTTILRIDPRAWQNALVLNIIRFDERRRQHNRFNRKISIRESVRNREFLASHALA